MTFRPLIFKHSVAQKEARALMHSLQQGNALPTRYRYFDAVDISATRLN